MNFSTYCAIFVAVVATLAVGLPTEAGGELRGMESSNVMLGLDVHQGDIDGDAAAVVPEAENEHMPPPGLDVTPDEEMPDMPVQAQPSVMVNTDTKISTKKDYVPSEPIAGGQDLTNANTAAVVREEAGTVQAVGAVTAAAERAGEEKAAVASHPGVKAAKAARAGGSKTTPSKKAAKTATKVQAKKGAAGRTVGVSMATAGLAVLVAVVGAM